MPHPREISISSYQYNLPDEKIAQYPAEPRDSSKLLTYRKGETGHSTFNKLPNELPSNTHLIFNNTKVVPARLFFRNRNGRVIEVFCLEPQSEPSAELALSQTKSTRWWCMVGGAKKWKEEKLSLRTGSGDVLNVKKIDREDARFLIEFSWEPKDLTFSQLLEEAGKVPLPPYMTREAEEEDKSRYQTVFAKVEGSVAAPTAGLHFTPSVLSNIDKAKINSSQVTLHVSAGTFKPVQTDKIGDHAMHGEFFEVSKNTVEELLKTHDKTLITVGTTAMRTMESLYWVGAQIAKHGFKMEMPFRIGQWEPYDEPWDASRGESLQMILEYMKHHEIDKLSGQTEIIIAPGYEFKFCDGLITNFHQPGSTLLLLVAALIGSDWKKVYDYALNNDFRFLSYGDSSLLIP